MSTDEESAEEQSVLFSSFSEPLTLRLLSVRLFNRQQEEEEDTEQQLRNVYVKSAEAERLKRHRDSVAAEVTATAVVAKRRIRSRFNSTSSERSWRFSMTPPPAAQLPEVFAVESGEFVTCSLLVLRHAASAKCLYVLSQEKLVACEAAELRKGFNEFCERL